MAREAFQVLVVPFQRLPSSTFRFLVLKRADGALWQFVSGGGEDGERPREAALREATEELGLEMVPEVYPLQSCASIPVRFFPDRERWPDHLLVIPEYCFAMDCTGIQVQLSEEHVDMMWGNDEECRQRLSWDSNRTALWELNERLNRSRLSKQVKPFGNTEYAPITPHNQ